MTLCILAAVCRGVNVPAQTPATPITVPNPTAAPQTAVAPLVDMTKISDPKLKAAIEEIARKVAGINEIFISEFRTNDPLLPLVSNNPAQVILRRNGYYFLCSRGLNKPQKAFTVNTLWMINDRRVFWTVLEGMGADPAGGAVKKRVTLVTKVDIDKVRAAGIRNDITSDTEDFDRFTNPFSSLDPASLKLVAESSREWTFTGNLLQDGEAIAHGAKTAKLTISKLNGLTVKNTTDGKIPVTETLDKVHVNLNPPVPDTYFKYTPPPDAYVLDATTQTIEQGRQKWGGGTTQGKGATQ